jgi:hypothetical protein
MKTYAKKVTHIFAKSVILYSKTIIGEIAYGKKSYRVSHEYFYDLSDVQLQYHEK